MLPFQFADMHADALMWNRDFLCDNIRGHVDLPKLQRGQVKLVGLPLVTQGFPYLDLFNLFAHWRGWPRSAIRGFRNRAFWQINKLEEYCKKSNGRLSFIHNRQQLQEVLTTDRVAAIIGLEGAQAFEGDLANVEKFYRRGVRFVGLTHLRDNIYGSAQKWLGNDRGLTSAGEELVDELERVGFVIDLSHASQKTLEQILKRFNGPVMFSHTAAEHVKPSWRNNDEEAFIEVAQRGGVIGVIFATFYLGGNRISDLIRHIEHIVNIAGIDHVGLGSDFDGFVPLPKGIDNVADLPKISRALPQIGFNDNEMAKIMGLNWIKFWKRELSD